MTAAVGAICIAIGALEGNVLTPWLMSRAGEMNAVAVFVSLMFWGWIWGVWGLLLAVPITAAVKAVAERTPDFNALAELLKE
jgi:predicted PurR-regulated permease PerM